jgi:hypothetical protein
MIEYQRKNPEEIEVYTLCDITTTPDNYLNK